MTFIEQCFSYIEGKYSFQKHINGIKMSQQYVTVEIIYVNNNNKYTIEYMRFVYVVINLSVIVFQIISKSKQRTYL